MGWQQGHSGEALSVEDLNVIGSYLRLGLLFIITVWHGDKLCPPGPDHCPAPQYCSGSLIRCCVVSAMDEMLRTSHWTGQCALSCWCEGTLGAQRVALETGAATGASPKPRPCTASLNPLGSPERLEARGRSMDEGPGASVRVRNAGK